jgi:hypothetical protein
LFLNFSVPIATVLFHMFAKFRRLRALQCKMSCLSSSQLVNIHMAIVV